jgi:alpha-tubulin suppressor-like RCC1 family protein
VCGLDFTDKAYCWGYNTNDIVAHGSGVANNITPILAWTTILEGITDISIGNGNTCIVTSSNKAYCNGSNGNYESTGLATISNKLLVSGTLLFKAIYITDSHSCAITTGNEAYCWGDNVNGEIGNNSATTKFSTPQKVLGGLFFKELAPYANRGTCGITLSGKAYCWGNGSQGMIGDGVNASANKVPVAVNTTELFQSIVSSPTSVCAENSSSAVYCWGRNNGEFYTNTGVTLSTTYGTPVKVSP